MKWISVKDKMPAVGVRVLIHWVSFQGRKYVEQGVLGETYTKKIKRFVDSRFRNLNGTVTHWMPMPEPPIDV